MVKVSVNWVCWNSRIVSSSGAFGKEVANGWLSIIAGVIGNSGLFMPAFNFHWFVLVSYCLTFVDYSRVKPFLPYVLIFG